MASNFKIKYYYSISTCSTICTTIVVLLLKNSTTHSFSLARLARAHKALSRAYLVVHFLFWSYGLYFTISGHLLPEHHHHISNFWLSCTFLFNSSLFSNQALGNLRPNFKATSNNRIISLRNSSISTHSLANLIKSSSISNTFKHKKQWLSIDFTSGCTHEIIDFTSQHAQHTHTPCDKTIL